MTTNNTIPDLYDIKSKYAYPGSQNSYDFWVPMPATEEEKEKRIDPFDRIGSNDDDFIPKCNNDMLYLMGQCESSNFEHDYCGDMLTDYIEENGLSHLDRPDHLTDRGQGQLRN